MKKRFLYILLIVICICCLSGCSSKVNKNQGITVVITPFEGQETEAPSAQNTQEPTAEPTPEPTEPPVTPFALSEQIYSSSALLNELHDDGDVTLLDINGDMQIYPASMTKIMTALVFLETEGALDKTYTVPQSIFHYLWETGASVAGFDSGEQLTGKDILYGILLPSGADACLTAAITLYGSEENFAAKMNEYAGKIGMTATHFVNTTGLHDPDHYTTVHDIYVLLRYALNNEELRTAITTAEYTSSSTAYHKDGITMKNTTIYMSSKLNYGTVHILGGKTGYTDAAGLCLASYAEHDGKYYILVTAGNNGNNKTEPYHFLDAQTIYAYLDK